MYKSEKGFAPLVVFLIVAALGTGGVATYKVIKENSTGQSSVFSTLLSRPTSNSEEITALEESTNSIDECPKPHTWALAVTESQINNYLDKNELPYRYKGYKVTGGNVDFGENAVTSKVELQDGKAFLVELSLIENGTNINVELLESVGNNSLSKLELAAIRAVLNNLYRIIWNYVPEKYAESFKEVSISGDKITVSFYTSEYLDCIR